MGISLGRMSLTFVSRLSNGRPKVCKAKAVKVVVAEYTEYRKWKGRGRRKETAAARMPNDYKLPVAILITATTAEQ